MTSILAAAGLALSMGAADPCQATAGHRTGTYTILVTSDGNFVRCLNGVTTEDEPLSHQRIVLELPALDPNQPYRYRLYHPSAVGTGHGHKQLLRQQLAVVQGFAGALHDLSSAPESVGEAISHLQPIEAAEGEAAAAPAAKGHAAPPSGAAAMAPQSHDVLEANAIEARYQSLVTPAFVKAFHQIHRSFGEVETAADRVDLVCEISTDRVREGKLRDAVGKLCAGGGPGAKLVAALKPFQAEIAAFVAAREPAKEAVLNLALTPTSQSEQDAAAHTAIAALQKAEAAARQLVADAGPAGDAVGRFGRDIEFLRAALSFPATPEPVRVHLGRYPANGLFAAPDIYQVHVLKEASPLFDLGEAPPTVTEEHDILSDHFQPQPRDYFTLGLAVLYSAGLPDHPDLVGRVGAQQLSATQTQGFLGGVSASLIPLSFTDIADPWASMLRFPTLIIPFTINPLENYFIGAGFGVKWIGSIDAGAHLALTRVPATSAPACSSSVAGSNGYCYQFSTSPIELDHVTAPGPLGVGWFVSLSLDVVGIVHLIVGEASPTVRDVTSQAESPSAPAAEVASAVPAQQH